MSIINNLSQIKKNIEEVCIRVGRNPDEITLVAVTKNVGLDKIKEALDLGITHIGENKVQEAILKYHQLPISNLELRTIKWHMVGHLQSNKVKPAVGLFDLIQSVDSLYLIETINKEAAKINKIQDILVQVNTSYEPAKFGLNPEELLSVIKEAVKFKNINLKGLMTIAPLVDDPEKARPYFRRLKELQDKINTLHITRYTLHILSMGMSDDYKIALEEGSTMLRLGRALFS